MENVLQFYQIDDNYSPREIQPNKLSVEQVTKMKDIYIRVAGRLDAKLDRESTFDDLIRDHIEQIGYDRTEKIYKGVAYAWNSIGRDSSDSDKVYQNYFGGVKEFYQTDETLTTSTGVEVNKIKTHSSTNYCKTCDSALYADSKECKKCEGSQGKGNSKKFDPFSFNSALYLGIGALIFYYLYKNIEITEAGFLIVGALVLLGIMYFGDESNK